MAKIDKLEVEEEFDELDESGGGFSKFLFFMTPILFTIVLLGVLLTLFNINIRDGFIDLGNKIPIVKNFVPDPKLPDDAKKAEEIKKQEKSTEATIEQLKEQVAKKDSEIAAINIELEEQTSKAKDLQLQLDSALVEQTKQEQSAAQESYEKEVKKLSQLYAQMSPGKAAAIMSNLTMEESLQMLSVMGNENKAAILEKMDPQKAADISIRLKDVTASEDLAISALQSRLDLESANKTVTQNKDATLDTNQISSTFRSMPEETAAALVIQTYKLSPDKALTILKAVDDNTRSKILAEINDKDDKISVKIINQLISK